jgi:hypothetical protein
VSSTRFLFLFVDALGNPEIQLRATKTPRPAKFECGNFAFLSEPIDRSLAGFQVGSIVSSAKVACNEFCLPNLANFTASDQKITVDSYKPPLTVQLRQQQVLPERPQ